jgi:CubicO group peptidase (beta-lactamase class C family)
MRNGSEGQCISKFAQEAANGKIDELKHKNLNYGYQIWVQQPQLENKIYMWLGAYGQRVMIDPKNEKILILFRNKNDYSTSELISKFFLVWSQTN